MVKRGTYTALLICAMLSSIPAVAAQAGPDQEQWGVIQSYCFGCHNSKARVGGLALDSMSADRIAEDASTWETAIRKLRGGLMPPLARNVRRNKRLPAWSRGLRTRLTQPLLVPSLGACHCIASTGESTPTPYAICLGSKSTRPHCCRLTTSRATSTTKPPACSHHHPLLTNMSPPRAK